MLHLQGESGNWRQNAGVAMQAHISPSLPKALAGKINKTILLDLRLRKNKKLMIMLFCGRTSITLALYAAMNYQQTIRNTKTGKRGRKRPKKRGKAQRMLSAEENICTFKI